MEVINNFLTYILTQYEYYQTWFLITFPPYDLIHNKSAIILMAITIVIQHLKYQTRSLLGVCLFNLFGTFFHEATHYIVAFVLGCRPKGFTIIPKKVNGDWLLGSVTITRGRSLHLIVVSLAPLLLLPLAFYFERYFFYYAPLNYGTIIIYYFCLVNLLVSSLPSSIDFKVAYQGVIGIISFCISLIVFFAVILAIIYFTR